MFTSQDFWETSRHSLSRSLVIAANKDLGVLEAFMAGAFGAAILNRHRLWNLCGFLVFQGLQFDTQFLHLTQYFTWQSLVPFRQGKPKWSVSGKQLSVQLSERMLG